MTATYPLPFTDLSRVRFALGDTDVNAAMFSDEEINALITETGSWQKAVIACIRHLIALLSVPTFTADWLTVDPSRALAGYRELLNIKAREYGLPLITATAVHLYRPDSGQDAAPDWSGVQSEYSRRAWRDPC